MNATNGAVVVIDSKTGEILAMVGSYDYNDEKFGKFNAALGLRQPGSAIKPITYATAFEKGYTPATVVIDVSTEFFSGKTGGAFPLAAMIREFTKQGLITAELYQGDWDDIGTVERLNARIKKQAPV